MTRAINFGLCVALAGLVSGCITPQSYVDPAYRKATAQSMMPADPPTSAQINVEFFRNGERFKRADKQLRGAVVAAVEKSRVLRVSKEDGAVASLYVSANNIADMEAARSQGFKTGLTFGGVGTYVDDNYDFKCVFTNSAAKRRELKFQHAIHTAIGKTDERPKDQTPTSPAKAFDQVVEDVVFNCLTNMQISGAF